MLDRRGFLQLSHLGFWGTGLVAHLLGQRAVASPRTPRARACILLFQVGGPYQCDTFDPKPDAPEEMRGPYKPLRTRVPGLLVTEALPRVAVHADKIAILRGVHHTIRCHNPAIYCTLVGREATDPMAVSNRTNAKRTDHPHHASVIAKLRPAADSVMPHHVVLPDLVLNGPAKAPGLQGGYLGASYDPFVLGADPASPSFRVDAMAPPADVTHERLDGRQGLLAKLDAGQRRLESGEGVASLGSFQRRAFELLTSPRTKRAFALEQEPPAVRDRYGRHTVGQSTLLARRLVEAGVPFVSVFSHTAVEKESWDTHSNHDEVSRKLLPLTDQSFGALLDDLDTRGLLDEVLVVWLGEFGRTPRRGMAFSNAGNSPNGRDHWCNCYSVVLAGGGVRGGSVVGASDWIGGYPKERPVHISDLAATLFHAFGVDPRSQVHDIQGQPHSICDGYPVEELF
jgi:hypothetical protein